jgi:uncharacterized protein YndB with AHSA1/START domain
MSEKVKIELEFPLNTSTKLLYNCLSTPSGLAEWFADDVDIKNDVFTFKWDGSEESARLVAKKPNERVKFQWLEEDDDYFFEFFIKVDDITKGVSLHLTDFADEDEVEESTLLWNNQINNLKNTIGG